MELWQRYPRLMELSRACGTDAAAAILQAEPGEYDTARTTGCTCDGLDLRVRSCAIHVDRQLAFSVEASREPIVLDELW